MRHQALVDTVNQEIESRANALEVQWSHEEIHHREFTDVDPDYEEWLRVEQGKQWSDEIYLEKGFKPTDYRSETVKAYVFQKQQDAKLWDIHSDWEEGYWYLVDNHMYDKWGF